MASHGVAAASENELSNLKEKDFSQSSDFENTNGVRDTANGTDKERPNSSSIEADNGLNCNGNFEKLEYAEAHADLTLKKLAKKMEFHYDIRVNRESEINIKCRELFRRDFIVKIVTNDIARNYPYEIIIPVGKASETDCMQFDVEKYSELIKAAHTARLRSRFVVPVILFDNKFICRAGTTTSWISAVHETINPQLPSFSTLTNTIGNPFRSVFNVLKTAYDTFNLIRNDDGLEEILTEDAELLKFLKIERICDLMVEERKNYRDLLQVSSAEKLYQMYKNFKIESMPYPGCEFFEEYGKLDLNKKRLVENFETGTYDGFFLNFDWNQSDVTRTLELTEDVLEFFPDLDIENHKKWDLITLTKNYLKIILYYLAKGTEGILVHCVSGWDRTPLFISLIRMSLWADDVLHEDLSGEEFMYLTLAYDWYLFGHNLPDRLLKNQEIMQFCFDTMAEVISSDEYSITKMFQNLPPQFKEGRTFPQYRRELRTELWQLRVQFQEFYNSIVNKD